VSDTGTRKIARGKLPINPIQKLKEDFLDAERRWLFPARSYAAPRNPPGRERPTIQIRLPVLGAIALMVFNCEVAVAEPNQTSADYIMSGCRDAASLIAFSNVRESEEEAYRKGLCAGLLLALASWVSLRAYVCPRARLLSKPPVSSFSTSTHSPRGFTRTSTVLPLRHCEQIGRVR
jgi:hypothetical protein